MSNAINPEHYNRLNPQPKDVIRAWGLNFNLGSAVKLVFQSKRPTFQFDDDVKQRFIRKVSWCIADLLFQCVTQVDYSVQRVHTVVNTIKFRYIFWSMEKE